MTQPELEDQLAVLLGGRAAEQLHYNGVVSTGAANDLDRASELARQMVTRFGMSEVLGKLTYGRPLGTQFLKTPFDTEERNYSDETARLIDGESKRIVEAAFAAAQQILSERAADLRVVAEALALKETLMRSDLDALLHSS